MTAIFFAKPGKDSSGKSEYERYEAFAQKHMFEEKKKVHLGDAQYDTQQCYYKRISDNDVCVFCENIKGEDFLLFKNCSTIEQMKEQRQERIWDLLEYGRNIVVAVEGDAEVVKLFWHNGNDIPIGCEEWAESEIKDCEGFENWSLALLSSVRNSIFDLYNLDKSIFQDVLDNETKFREWIDGLDKKLRGVSGDGCL